MADENEPAELAQWFEIKSTFGTRYLAEKSALPLASASGARVYEEKLRRIPPDPKYALVPHMIYFYYVRIDTDGKLKVDHYTYEPGGAIPPTTIQARVQHLVDRVRGVNNDPMVIHTGSNFEDIKWERISYIAFFVDEEHWTLHQDGSGLEGVRFVSNVGGAYPNHTFYDADDFLIRVQNATSGAVTHRSAIAFINHMKKNANGDPLGEHGPEEQKFKFEMLFDVKFAHTSTVGMTVIFDPDGTNTGPPIGPPP